jgi:hypothetical protein
VVKKAAYPPVLAEEFTKNRKVSLRSLGNRNTESQQFRPETPVSSSGTSLELGRRRLSNSGTHMRFLILILSAFAFLFWGVTRGYTTTTKTARDHKVSRAFEFRARYKMQNSRDVVMYLAGTTPVRDWKMKAHGLQGEAQMVLAAENQLVGIDALTFSLPVRNLKGDQTAMDEDAYRALKADQYKEIVFLLKSAKVEPAGDQKYLIKALGTLTVAGVTKVVTLTMRGTVASDGSITFAGSETLRMSDYNVERPTLLFGVIRAGDEMTLTYKLIFSK